MVRVWQTVSPALWSNDNGYLLIDMIITSMGDQIQNLQKQQNRVVREAWLVGARAHEIASPMGQPSW